MKLGIIFKKEFKEVRGDKIEFFGDIIIIKRKFDSLFIQVINSKTDEMEETHINPDMIQLIYLGGWK